MATSPRELSFFDRSFHAGESLTRIGAGALGGKAMGLVRIQEVLEAAFPGRRDETPIQVVIPTLIVLTTDVFDAFMRANQLQEIALSDEPDERIAHTFQRAELPVEVVGDLRALVREVHTPLAVRSSSLLEDALFRPFAGVYGTKMIPNNQPDADTRFRRLAEAIKFVWASTYFRAAKDYVRATDQRIEDERMAVIVQEVVGRRHGDRFYPSLSGVARSYDFYPFGAGEPADGVVNLALGLGKTIVDGGVCWTFSPAHPRATPPFASASDLLRRTQTQFWAVNMGRPPEYDPIRETEYLLQATLQDADLDGALRYVASTYLASSDRFSIGVGSEGPRALTFAPILDLEELPLAATLRRLLDACEEAVAGPVEIEFALTIEPGQEVAARFGFLQVRPMVVTEEAVEVTETEMMAENVLLASTNIMGNGIEGGIRDVVYVRRDTFDARHTRAIAAEIGDLNHRLVTEGRPYILIGFGRWGSSDPWLGIPVQWGQISGARAIVEVTRPDMNVDVSQGSHFFHNVSSFRVGCLAVRHDAGKQVDWRRLETAPTIAESGFVRHVRLPVEVVVKLDGRRRRGVVLAGEATAGRAAETRP